MRLALVSNAAHRTLSNRAPFVDGGCFNKIYLLLPRNDVRILIIGRPVFRLWESFKYKFSSLGKKLASWMAAAPYSLYFNIMHIAQLIMHIQTTVHRSVLPPGVICIYPRMVLRSAPYLIQA
jgi:hypothetical protein